MIKKILSAFFCAVLIFGTAVYPAAQSPQKHAENAEEILIYTKDSVSKKELLRQDDIIDAEKIDMPCEDDTSLFLCSADGDTESVCEELEKDEDILIAEPDYTAQTYGISLPEEVKNTSPEYDNFHRYFDFLEVQKAWENADTMGREDIVVAVLDTGLNTSHTDIKDSLWYDENGNCGYNTVSDNYDLTDTVGHGSNVAGIIAMQNNSSGYVGISPNVKIMPIKVTEASNGSMTISNIVKGLKFATDNGADIINMSFGTTNFSAILLKALQTACKSAVLVSAAGNSGTNAANGELSYPAAANCVIGVMSCGDYENTVYPKDADDTHLSSFSNYDTTGKYYNICAPGVNIIGVSNEDNNKYTLKSGTSQASPIVAGAAALYMSTHPNASPEQVFDAVVKSGTASITDDSGRQYNSLNICNMLNYTPSESSTAISDGAKEILRSAFDLSQNEPITSLHEKFVTVLTSEDIGDNINSLCELTNTQVISLSDMNLGAEQVNKVFSADFDKLWALELDGNAIAGLNLGENCDTLKNISVCSCSLTNLNFLEKADKLIYLYASGNALKTTYELKGLKKLMYADLSANKICEISSLESLKDLHNLNLCTNELTDITPLYGYTGRVLKISDNPIAYAPENKRRLDIIDESMKSAGYATYTFEHKNLNGTDYTPAKEISCESISVARSAQKAKITAVTKPKQAILLNTCTFYSDNISVDEQTGEVCWNAEDITHSVTRTVCVKPAALFSEFYCNVNILAPQIIYFSKDGTVVANSATEYIKIGTHKYTSFTEINGLRTFITDSASDSDCAAPYDSYGSGESVCKGASSGDNNTYEKTLHIETDKSTYFTGDTAYVSITADNCADRIKIYSSTDKTAVVCDAFNTDSDGNRVFKFNFKLTAKGEYKFKVYTLCENEEDFGFCEKEFSLKVLQQVKKVNLTADESTSLYLYEKDSVKLSTIIYPKNADIHTDFNFTSSDNSVATVDSAGTVHSVSYGTCKISAENADGVNESITIKVSPPRCGDDISAQVNEKEEKCVFTLKSVGAKSIIMFSDDKQVVDPSLYTVKKEPCQGEYKSKWTVTYKYELSGRQSVYFVPVDELGINDFSKMYKKSFTAKKACTDFNITAEKSVYPRSVRHINIKETTLPTGSSGNITYTCDDPTVATVSKTTTGAFLNIQKDGKVTVTANLDRAGETVQKKLNFTFTKPEVYDVTFESCATKTYQKSVLLINTDKGTERIKLKYDNKQEEYSDIYYYTDGEQKRVWRIPCYFSQSSQSISVYAGDSLGFNDECKSVDIKLIESNSPHLEPFKICSASDTFTLESAGITDFTCEQNGVIKINDDSSITALQAGTVTVSAKDENSKTHQCVITVLQYAQDICFDTENIILDIGDKFTLKTVCEPSKVSDRLKYASSDTSVIEVSPDGILTAVGYGNATVTCTGEYADIFARAEVCVVNTKGATELYFEKENYTVASGDIINLKALTTPQYSNDEITYSSDNPNILAYEGDGKFTCKTAGKVTVSAKTQNGLSAKTTVNVIYAPTLSLNKTYANISVGSGTVLRAEYSQTDNLESTVWYSSNKAIAAVTDTGTVYGISAGECDIYAVSKGGLLAVCHITVSGTPANAFTLSNSEISLPTGSTYIIGCELNPIYSDEKLTWKSSDESVVSVSDGVVKCLKAGTCTVTATAQNGTSQKVIINSEKSEYTVSGKVSTDFNTAVKVTFADTAGNEYTFNCDKNTGKFSTVIPYGTYTATFSSKSYTNAVIKEISLREDTALSTVKLYCGDVNSDNCVDTTDVTAVLSKGNYASTSNKQNSACDVNGDGIIDSNDIAVILTQNNYSKFGKEYIY